MLDREGFRPNVGIILLNHKNEVFWGKRIRTHSWQFPQGGIKHGETPEQAMFRELHEEVGLVADHVRIIARTRDWLRYEVPDHFIRRDARGHYRGQKQIWFLLQLTGRDSDMNLRATDHPEFDAWRWNEYWVPLEAVIEFKRGVYQMALTELARFLPRLNHHNRYLRAGMRPPPRGDRYGGPGEHDAHRHDRFQDTQPHDDHRHDGLPHEGHPHEGHPHEGHPHDAHPHEERRHEAHGGPEGHDDREVRAAQAERGPIEPGKT